MKKLTLRVLLATIITIIFIACQPSGNTPSQQTGDTVSASTMDDSAFVNQMAKDVVRKRSNEGSRPTDSADVMKIVPVADMSNNKGIDGKPILPKKHLNRKVSKVVRMMKKNHMQPDAAVKMLKQQSAPVSSNTGYGYTNPYEYIGTYYLPQNDTFQANTGWHKLSTTSNFEWVDSMRYGVDVGFTAIVGDSVNTDGLKPGIYNYNLALVSQPREDFRWHDTVQRAVVIVQKR